MIKKIKKTLTKRKTTTKQKEENKKMKEYQIEEKRQYD